MSRTSDIVTKIKEAIDDYRTGIDDFGGHALECPFRREGEKCAANPMGYLPCAIGNCPLYHLEDVDNIDWEVIKNNANI